MKRIFPLFLFVWLAVSSNSIGQFNQPLWIPDTVIGPILNISFGASQKSFFQGQASETFSYNNLEMLGPTLILRRGWEVEASIQNQLNDTTTFHWHGIHLPAHADGGPHSPILPGQTSDPHFTCLNKAGTSWYHPHFHGKTARQTLLGGYGLILIRDSQEEALALPRAYGKDDFPIMIQSVEFKPDNQIKPEGSQDSIILVNGGLKPFLGVPAQWIRLRVLNASNARNYSLGFSNGMSFRVIAGDGGLLNRSLEKTRLRICPGERYEILVNLKNKEDEEFFLKNFGGDLAPGTQGGPNIPVPIGAPSMNSPLNGKDFDILQIRVMDALPNDLDSVSENLAPDPGPDLAEVDEERSLIFKPSVAGSSVGPFLLNDSIFNMDRIDLKIPLNHTEIWNIHNQTVVAHPFHLHGFSFYLLDRYGNPPDSFEIGRKDMVQIFPNEMIRIWVKFSDFPDSTMPYMYHCHILSHEDEGMMGQFVVVPQPTSVAKYSNLEDDKSIYPNPFQDVLNLKGLILGEEIQIVNVLGEPIWSGKFEGAIVSSSWKRGLYILKYQNSRKIIVKD